MKKFFVEHPKLKNPYFYLSVIGLIFSASGVDFNQLTSWSLLGKAIIDKEGNKIIESCGNIYKITNYKYNFEHISITIKDKNSIFFPYFSTGAMYKRMEADKHYTVEELGI